MAKLPFKDCSPFDFEKDEQKKQKQVNQLNKCLPMLLRKSSETTEDEAEAERFFVFSDRDYDTDDEAIVYQKSNGQWWAGRYVGKCKIDGYEIEIQPRFGSSFLLTMLDEVYNLKLRKSFEAASGDKDKQWESIVKLALYVVWTTKFMNANRYGLPRRVVKREYVGNKIKSHLNVRGSIKTLHTRQQLVSEYYERDYDDTICKIVYHAYKILEKISRRIPTGQTPQMVKETIQQLDSHYHSADLTVTPHEYHHIRYKSIYASWKPLVDLSWQIIQQQFGLIESQSPSYAVFIDVAEIWEQYLRKQLADAFKDDGWHCWTVEETMMKVYEGKFYSRRIIPDIVLSRDKEKEYMVFDAKYKRMTGQRDDVDRGDFFQIHSYIQYMQSQGHKVLVGGLLYPINKGEEDFSKWHSQHLWGKSDNQTPFIVDGIVCDKDWSDKNTKQKDVDSQISANTEAFIKRIKEIIKEKQMIPTEQTAL